MTTWWNLTLQDRASPVIEQLIFFHDHELMIILIITTAVFYTTIRTVQNKQTRRFILEGQIIETIWTIAPAVILVFISIPISTPTIPNRRNSQPGNNTKTAGHQWYWSYEYSDFTQLEFNSYEYTGCNRRNGPDFGRVFLMLNYTEKLQNTYIQNWTVWEIMAIENCGLPSGPRTIAVSWHSYLLVCQQQAGVLRHHSTFQYDV